MTDAEKVNFIANNDVVKELYVNMLFLKAQSTVLRGALSGYLKGLDSDIEYQVFEKLLSEQIPALINTYLLESPYREAHLDDILRDLLKETLPPKG